ncbi:hypothetical protein ONZ45_g1501 [Pleurotus djamor]|nr:hypothetical protein ONZ45_g1501 [Pleurotus djamor]
MGPIVAEEDEPTSNPSPPPTSSVHDLTISSSQFNQVGRDQHISHVTNHHHAYNPCKIIPIPLPLPTSTHAS